MANAFYETTSGDSANFDFTFAYASTAREYATKIIVPAGQTLTVDGGVVRLGATLTDGALGGSEKVGSLLKIVGHNAVDDEPDLTNTIDWFVAWTTQATSALANRTLTPAFGNFDLTEGTYWLVMDFYSQTHSGYDWVLHVGKNTGPPTNVVSDIGLGHTGRTGYSDAGTVGGQGDFSGNMTDDASLYFSITGTLAVVGPSKATNPSPTNGATNTDGCFDRRLSWTGDINADSHEVFIGSSSGNLSSIGSTTNDYIIVPEANFPKETVVYWRVDSTEDTETTTGDEWNFDPRPTKTTSPTPPDGTGSLTLNPSKLYWDPGSLNQTFDVYLGLPGGLVQVATGVTAEDWDTSDLGVYSYIPLAYGTLYNWRIDAVNVNGTATGDTWEFTTVAYAPPTPSTSATRSGGAPGVGTFVDGANFIASNRRLIAACANAIFYEPYDED